MSPVPANAVTDLLKREPAKIVAATGMFFESLVKKYAQQTVSDVLQSYRSGVWGDEAGVGSGYPVLRSTNMRGTKADIADVAWREIPSKRAADCALQTGDILVTKSSGSSDLVGKSVLFVHPGDQRTYLFSNFTLRLRPNIKVMAPAFLAWFLRSPQALGWRYDTQQNAVGLRNLQTKEFLAQHLPTPPLSIQGAVTTYLDGLETGQNSSAELPSELAEERRIVARIEELSAKIEEARILRSRATDQMALVIAAQITKLFSSGPRHGWRTGCLGDYVIDDCYGTSEKTTDDSTATPILRMGNIQNGHLDLRNLKYLPIFETGRDKLILKKGDILVNRTNSAELVGKCAVFDAPGEYGFASYLIRIRLDPDRADPRLVAAYINSPAGREYMFRERKQMTGQANVNSKKLKALPIVLPNLPEQRRIVAYLDDLQQKVNTVKTLQEESEAELNALMPSILSRAFAGEL